MKSKGDVAGSASERVFLSKGRKGVTGPSELSWLVNFWAAAVKRPFVTTRKAFSLTVDRL